MKFRTINQNNSKSKKFKIQKKKNLKRTSKNKKIKIEFTSFQIKKKTNKSNNNLINSIEEYENYYEKTIENSFKNNASRIMENLIKKDINNIIINHDHKFSIDLDYRSSLINFLFYLVDVNQCESEIYFLAISIFDSFIEKSNEKIEKREGAKLLMTSFYIALKFESVDNISSDFLSCFNFNEYQFTPLELEQTEKLIYDKIGLIFNNNSIMDYYSICIFDFKLNYNQYLNNVNILINENNYNNNNLFVKLQNYFVYMLKLVPLDIHLFYSNKKFELVIVCLIYSFDFLRSYITFLNKEYSIFQEWILTFFKSMNYDINKIKAIYNQMESFYSNVKINIFEIWDSLKL